MPTITFKAKPKPVYNMDDSLAYYEVKVPAIKTSHCDMHAFRTHPKYGAWANSDMFQGMINRDIRKLGVRDWLKTNALPDCVSMDDSGFLAKFTINLE